MRTHNNLHALKLQERGHRSIPGLSDNGLLTRERPRVAAVVGNVRKETEFGDVADDDEDFGVDDDIPSCDWKFNETPGPLQGLSACLLALVLGPA
ncbi:unnamed protein product [Symbiodinium sp. CCMP2592]|nr:unnamed protein product [Symbiodinium sp. CCMP2592]CAE7733083.1 unnamed protein product [Symbiodinium sp. CCMP2592]